MLKGRGQYRFARKRSSLQLFQRCTPSKQVWIFDGRQTVLLKVDCQQERTRVCVWFERSAATRDVTILLREA
jgi:hypothetical protein